MNAIRPRILLVSTGGTITMTPETSAGVEPTLSGDDLVRAVPALADHCLLEVVSFAKKPGASLTFSDMKDIAAIVERSFRADCQGAVVVQGTDTIEETAFALDLLVASEKPVVVTGAMRNAVAPGADGPANLLAAVLVAASPLARERGTMVVFNDRVYAAKYVQKTDTASPAAFQSPATGPLGRVDERHAAFHAPAQRTEPLPVPAAFDKPVAILKVCLDDDGRLARQVPALGYAGVVLEAMGAGHLPVWYADIVSELAMKMPLVLATRVPAGPVFTRTYGFVGSETDSLNRGAIPGGSLGSVKSRLLLSFLLAGGARGDELKREFMKRT
jgi:L-asparaginase